MDNSNSYPLPKFFHVVDYKFRDQLFQRQY